MTDMNNNLIMTYGLAEQQNALLAEKFPSKQVSDATDCFTDLLAVPAAAVVVNSDVMNADQKAEFNEAFGHDYDTCIAILGDWDEMDMRFFHVREKNAEGLLDTINCIKERFLLPDRYQEAMAHTVQTISEIETVLKPDPDGSYRDQIIHMNSYSNLYDTLTEIIAHISELKSLEKVPYKIELNAILQAVMVAHGLKQIDDMDNINMSDDWIDRKWIADIAGRIKDHYNKTVSKNGRRE